ncbi:hypothetical protein [Streptomyces sp. NPDC003032]
MDAYVQLFSDGAGHTGSSVTNGGFTRLESGGRILAEGGPGAVNAELPAASASYRLTMEATPDEEPTALPLSTVRVAPKLALNGTAPAGSTLKVPLKVAGAAAHRQDRHPDRQGFLRRGQHMEVGARNGRQQRCAHGECEAPGDGQGRLMPRVPEGHVGQHRDREDHERVPARPVTRSSTSMTGPAATS